MITKDIVIKNELGLGAKQAAVLIQKVSGFKSMVWIEKDERKANAKSLLGLLSLGISKGMKVVVRAEGEDEEQVASELENYFNSNMEEAI